MKTTYNEVWFNHIGECSNGTNMLYEESCDVCKIYVTIVSEEAKNRNIP